MSSQLRGYPVKGAPSNQSTGAQVNDLGSRFFLVVSLLVFACVFMRKTGYQSRMNLWKKTLSPQKGLIL